MKQLFLTCKSGSCTLYPSDLDRYPDSLLSKIASSEAGSSTRDPTLEGDDGTESCAKHMKDDKSCISLNVSALPKNPLNDWPEAPEMLPMLYRKSHLSTTLLEQLLEAATGHTDANSTHSTSSTRHVGGFLSPGADGSETVDIDAAFKPFYDKLGSLLEFLALPGNVSQWLPLQDIQLADGKALEFSYACIAFEAADLILSYKPHETADGFEHSNVAAFLVTADKERAGLAVHKVCASNLAQLQEIIIQCSVRPGVCSNNVQHTAVGPSITSYTMVDAIRLQCTTVQRLPTCDNNSSPFADIAVELASKVIGPYPTPNQTFHPGHGRFLAEALHAACGRHLSGVVCYVGVTYSNSVAGPNVPLWVVQWI